MLSTAEVSNHRDEFTSSNICRVGYALNPKKLRKSGLETNSPKLDDVCHESHLTKGNERSNSLVDDDTLNTGSANSKYTHWKGGGLADIICDGAEYEGVQFVPWDFDIPATKQVIDDKYIRRYRINAFEVFLSKAYFT